MTPRRIRAILDSATDGYRPNLRIRRHAGRSYVDCDTCAVSPRLGTAAALAAFARAHADCDRLPLDSTGTALPRRLQLED